MKDYANEDNDTKLPCYIQIMHEWERRGRKRKKKQVHVLLDNTKFKF